MTNLQHTQPEPQSLTFVRKTIRIGPVDVEGFMLPNGEFRQGLASTGRAIGRSHQRVSRIVSGLLTAGADPLQGKGSRGFSPLKPAGSKNLSDSLPASGSRELQARQPVASDPVIKLVGRPESLLSLAFAQKVWSYEARYGEGVSQEMAWRIIDTLAGVSLERSYQEAFGVQDSRGQSDRLLDFFINWNIGPRRVLFDRQFQIQFKRVTGYDVNSPSGHVRFIISNFLWNRLPAEVYEAVMDLNPKTEDGRRKYRHLQFITEDAKLEVVVPIVSALRACLTHAPSGSVKSVNEQMDRLYPTQRGTRLRTSNMRFNQLAVC